MSFAPINTYFDQDATILGAFVEKDFDELFEFTVNDEETSAFNPEEYPHKVYVTSNPLGGMHAWRYARVLKTVAYIITDEDENGDPVVEKWDIKRQQLYVNNSK